MVASQFEICRLIGGKGSPSYVIVLQHDRLDDLKTRIVAPLLPGSAGKPLGRINPLVSVDGHDWIVAFDQIATVDIGRLSVAVASAKDRHADFIAAIDMMFTGY